MIPIKVAICYRGQMRMIGAADKMRHRIMRSLADYDIDIRFFGHTIKSETIAYTAENPDLSEYTLRENRILELDDVLQRIKLMGIHGFRIFEHGMNYHTAASILDYWSKHPEFGRFLDSCPPKYHFVNAFTVRNYPKDIHFLGQNAAQKEMYFRNQIFIGDFMSQYVSAGHSIQMAIDYYHENDWKPDIIILMRWDSAIDLFDFFGLLESVKIDRRIYCRGLVVKDSMALMDDLVFVTDYDTAEQWLGDIDNRMFDLLTDWRVITAASEFNIRSLPHTFWSFLTRFDVKYANTTLFEMALMRPGIENELDVSVATMKEIDSHCKRWNQSLDEQLELLGGATRPEPFEYVKQMLGLPDDFTL